MGNKTTLRENPHSLVLIAHSSFVSAHILKFQNDLPLTELQRSATKPQYIGSNSIARPPSSLTEGRRYLT
jgi:hypothetical protein